MTASEESGFTLQDNLCLASCVMRIGEDNWSAVSKMMKTNAEAWERNSTMFTQKNCAHEYSRLIESVVIPKRKRSESSGGTELPTVQLVSRLTLERINELKKAVEGKRSEYTAIKDEMDAIRAGKMDGKLPEMYQEIFHQPMPVSTSTEGLLSETDEPSSEDELETSGEQPTTSAGDVGSRADSGELSTSGQPPPELSTPTKKMPSDLREVAAASMSTPVTPVTGDDVKVSTQSPSRSPAVSFVSASPTKSVTRSPVACTPNVELGKLVLEASVSVSAEPVDSVAVEEKESKKEPIILKIKAVPRDKTADLHAAVKIEAEEPVEDSSTEEPPASTQLTPIVSKPATETALEDTKPTVPPQEADRSQIRTPDGRTSCSEESLSEATTSTPQEPPPCPSPIEAGSKSGSARRGAGRKSVRGESATPSRKGRPSRDLNSSNRNNRGHHTRSDVPEGFSNAEDYKHWKRSIMLLWKACAGHRHANVFMHPVTDEIAPDYDKIVFQPMDLQTMKKNIENGKILTAEHFQRDMLLMFSNAVMYNNCDHEVHKMALEMSSDVISHIKESLQATDMFVPLAISSPASFSLEPSKSLRSRGRVDLSNTDLDESGVKRSNSGSDSDEPLSKRIRS